MNEIPQCLYEFGDFQLDTSERVLLHKEKAIPLTPKVFETLLALVENHGRTMGKEELMTRLWPDSFVEESNLTQNISVLRRALGENSGTPRYIETVPKRGYRFIAEVREQECKPALVVKNHTVTRLTIETGIGFSDKPGLVGPISWKRLLPEGVVGWVERSPRAAAISTFGISACFLGFIFWLLALPKTPSAWQGQLHATQLFGMKSLQGGMLSDSRFSPEGKMIAYTVAEKNAQHIWIMQTDGSRPNQVTQDESHDACPIWSPEGTRIAYISDRDQQLGIWAVKFLGGTPELLKVLDTDPVVTKGSPYSLVAWGKNDLDKVVIYYKSAGNLYRFDQSTQTTVQLTRFDTKKFGGYDFSLSPDEKQAVFIARRQDQWDLWRIVFGDDTPIRITNEPGEKRFPRWDPDGEWIFYDSFRDGQTQLHMVATEGGMSFPLRINGPHDYLTDVSADGRQLLCYGERQESDLFAIDIYGGAASERQLTDYLGAEFWPSVAPDGQHIAFHFLPGERFNWDPRQSSLRVRSLTDRAIPLELATSALEPQWSPDGKWIAFLQAKKSAFQMILVRPVGGERQVLVDNNVFFAGHTTGPAFNAFKVSDFVWSPDSRQIAYCTKVDGLMSLYTVDIETRRKTMIASGNDLNQEISNPLWSLDGRQVAWTVEVAGSQTSKWSRSLWLTSLDSPQPKMIWQTSDNLRLLGWSAEDELIIVTVGGDELNRARRANLLLSRYKVTMPAPKLIRELAASYFSNTHLSPDKRNVSVVSALDDRDNIWIVPLTGGEPWQVTFNADPKVFVSSLAWLHDNKTICLGKQTRWSVLSIITQ